MSNWVYLSHFYNDKTPGYGGKKDFLLHEDRSISKGDKCNQLKFSMSNHVGTHIDLPFHFDKDGKKLQDYGPNEWFFEQVELIDISLIKNELIFSQLLPKLNDSTEVLLLRTGFEQFREERVYWEENPGLTAELGNFLKRTYPRLKVIGLDFISATPYQNREEGKLAHLSFLGNQDGNPILIVEDMKLSSVLPQTNIKQMNIAPFLIESADGTPVTISAYIE